MLKEAEVMEAVARLPSHSFLRRYVEYAVSVHDSNAANHLAAGLCLLSITAPMDLFFPFPRKTRGNVFTLIVAPQGHGKTDAITLMRDLMREAGHAQLVADTPASEEYLVDAVAERPQQLFVYSEFGHFLAQTHAGYRLPIRTKLLELADCDPVSRAGVNKNARKAPPRCDDPRVSFIGGTNERYLERFTDDLDWGGGLMSRFLVFHSRQERKTTFREVTSAHNEQFIRLVEEFRSRMIKATGAVDPLSDESPQGKVGPCVGFEAGAQAYYESWAQTVIDRMQNPAEVEAAFIRSRVHALRTGLLLGLDFAAPRDNSPWRVPYEAIDVAIRVAEMHIRSVTSVFHALANNRYARDKRTVYEAIDAGSRGTSIGDILHRTNLDPKTVQTCLDGLIQEKKVQKATGTPNYFRTDAVVVGNRVFTPEELASQSSSAGGGDVVPFRRPSRTSGAVDPFEDDAGAAPNRTGGTDPLD